MVSNIYIKLNVKTCSCIDNVILYSSAFESNLFKGKAVVLDSVNWGTQFMAHETCRTVYY